MLYLCAQKEQQKNYKEMEKKSIGIVYDRIVKESDKAICFKVTVTWNWNKLHKRDIWVPRSVIDGEMQNGFVYIASWFVSKLESSNAYKGYRMLFAYTNENSF